MGTYRLWEEVTGGQSGLGMGYRGYRGLRRSIGAWKEAIGGEEQYDLELEEDPRGWRSAMGCMEAIGDYRSWGAAIGKGTGGCTGAIGGAIGSHRGCGRGCGRGYRKP